jgi:thiol:disulfide interchange protein DsbD
MKSMCFLVFVLMMLACGGSAHDDSANDKENHDPAILNQYGFSSFVRLEEAGSFAQESYKPLFILFTGYGTLSQTGMEWEILQSKEIEEILKANFVLLTLNVDDRHPLSIAERSLELFNTDSIKTSGQFHLRLEEYAFNTRSQPFYAIADADLNFFSGIGYTPLTQQQNFLRFIKLGWLKWLTRLYH